MKIQAIVLCTLLSLLAVKAQDSEKCTGESTFYPSTKDCSQFYQCTSDFIPILHQCADGLEFNPVALYCDWPTGLCVIEEPSATTTEAPVTTEAPITTQAPITTTYPPYTTQEPPVTDIPVHENCLAGLTYFPSLIDCNSYYQCNSLNQAIEVSCSIGLEFNPNTNQCDWPGVCFITTTETPTTTEIPTTQPPTTQPPITTEAPVITDAPIPNDKCTDGVTYFPSTTDCTQYYQCVAGEPIRVQCPAGLEFHPIDLICDWPTDFCTIGGEPEIEAPTCPEIEDSTTVVHLPHSSNCELYYICLGGIPHELSCPPGTHWNVVESWCDFPELANCNL